MMNRAVTEGLQQQFSSSIQLCVTEGLHIVHRTLIAGLQLWWAIGRLSSLVPEGPRHLGYRAFPLQWRYRCRRFAQH